MKLPLALKDPPHKVCPVLDKRETETETDSQREGKREGETDRQRERIIKTDR